MMTAKPPRHIFAPILPYLLSVSLCLSIQGFLQAQDEVSLKGKRGLTLITHGFSGGGGLSPEWLNFAKAIRRRAGKGSVFINNPETGEWEALDTDNSNNPNDEIILLYNWAWASNNLHRGYLEASADHLFAALLNPPKELKLKDPKALLKKAKHFIGHSRGSVLLTVLGHHLGHSFPSDSQLRIEHFTTLDPHPAAPMGDCEIPGIAGLCPPSKDYDPHSIYLQHCHIVQRADNYYRQDGVYEDLITQKVIGPYDGIIIQAPAQHNHELNNATLSQGANTTWGGAHSSIATRWYYGTVDLENTDQHPISDHWYEEDPEYPAMGPQSETGYYFSRLGGGDLPDLLPDSVKILAEYANNAFYNGDFADGRLIWKGKIPGWEGNGAGGDGRIAREGFSDNFILRLERNRFNPFKKETHFRQHSLSYFPEPKKSQKLSLVFEYRVARPSSAAAFLEIDCILAGGNPPLNLGSISLALEKTDWQELKITLDPLIYGRVASLRFSLMGEDDNHILDIDNIRLEFN